MSRSKKKGCNPLVGILILGGILLILLVIGLFVGKIMMQNWVQGEGLQTMLKERAEAYLKAEVDIEDVKWEGFGKALVGTIGASGYEDAAFAKLDVNGVGININGWKDQTFRIPYISVSQAKGVISNDRLPGLFPMPEPSESQDSGSPQLPEWVNKRIPKRVEINDIVIGSVTLELKDENGATTMSIREAKTAIQPNLDNGIMEITAQGGKMIIAGAPQINNRETSLRCQGNSIFINDASLEIYDGGHIAGLGEVQIGETTQLDLDLALSNIDIEKVLTGVWRDRISGTVRGPVKVTGTPDNMLQKGTIHLDDGVLESIPLLDKIAQYTKSKRFSRLVLNQAQADFTVKGDLIELRNIQVESDGLTRIEGVLDKKGDAIAGVLNIGVTPGTLKWIPGAERNVFTQNRDGFLWTSMKINGTTDKVNEDLSQRMIGAAAADLVERLPENIESTVKGFIGLGGNNPNQPTGENTGVTGTVKGIIIDKVGEEAGETGKKLIKGLGTLFGQ